MRRSLMACSVLALLAAGPARAQLGETDRTMQRHTSPGTAVRIADYVRVNNRCKQNGSPQIVMLGPPAHGAIEQRSQDVTIQAVLAGGTDCRGKNAPGIVVYYTPASGFSGTDRFDYRVSYGSLSRHDTIVVDVR